METSWPQYPKKRVFYMPNPQEVLGWKSTMNRKHVLTSKTMTKSMSPRFPTSDLSRLLLGWKHHTPLRVYSATEEPEIQRQTWNKPPKRRGPFLFWSNLQTDWFTSPSQQLNLQIQLLLRTKSEALSIGRLRGKVCFLLFLLLLFLLFVVCWFLDFCWLF